MYVYIAYSNQILSFLPSIGEGVDGGDGGGGGGGVDCILYEKTITILAIMQYIQL